MALDLEALKIHSLPSDLSERDLQYVLDIHPHMYGEPLLVQARRRKNTRIKMGGFKDIYSGIADHLKRKIGNNWDPSRREVAAYCALQVAMISRRESIKVKLLDQFHRIYGLNSSTLHIEAQLPAAEVVEKWKKELAEKGFDEFKPVVEGEIVEVKQIEVGNADPQHARST